MVGNVTQPNDIPLANKNSKIYLFDIRSYTWVYTFEPSTLSNNSTSSDPSANPSTQPSNISELTTMKIVVATIGGIVGSVILMAIGFFGHKWYKKRQILKQNDVMRIYGNHGNTYQP